MDFFAARIVPGLAGGRMAGFLARLGAVSFGLDRAFLDRALRMIFAMIRVY
jgi:hypothetical protein